MSATTPLAPATSDGAIGPASPVGAHRAPSSAARAIVTTYGARAATLVAYLALLPVVLHSVGPDAYGLYALTVALGAIFQQDLGIGDATTRFIAHAHPVGDRDRMRQIAAASAGFYLVAALVMGAAVAASLTLTIGAAAVPATLHATAWLLVVLGSANVFLLLALSPARQVLAGIGRIDDVNTALIVQAVVRVVLTLTVCALGWGILAVALADLTATLVLGGLTLWLRRRRAPALTVHLADFRWATFRELFAMSAQLMVIGLSAVVVTQIGGVLTAVLLPLAFTALFTAGQRMYLVVKEVTSSLSTALLPMAAMQERTVGADAHRTLYLAGTRYANMLMTIVLVPAVLFMPVIMTSWIGSDGAPAALVAQILILSLFANNNHLLAMPILIAQGRVRPYAVLHAVWAVTGTALAALLGSALGLPGIALGLALPIVVLEPVYVAVVLRRVGAGARTFLVQCLLGPLLPAVPLAAALCAVAVLMRPSLAQAALLSAAWTLALGGAYLMTDAPARRALGRLMGRDAPARRESAG